MQWFKHDADANMDAKLQEVLLDYGLEGYGLYWYCIELITSKLDKDNLTFELEHDSRMIARNTGSTQQKVQEMMKRFVELKLFDENEGNIRCLKLLKRLDSSMTNSKQMRKFITTAKQCHDVVMTKPDNVMLEENRIDKNKKNSYPVGIDAELLQSISDYWNETMTTQPKVDLAKETQINKKRWSKIKKILVDHPDYKDHEYWAGHFGQLATLPELQWQRENKQITFDQAVQLDKFERNLGLMKMGMS